MPLAGGELLIRQKNSKQLRRIRLNSPGGLVVPALALGTAIRKFRFSTEVAAETDGRPQCASSCVYVFLGGFHRKAAVGQIGVHRFYQDLALTDPGRKAFDSKDLAEIQKLTATLVDYVMQTGGHPGLISRAANTPETRSAISLKKNSYG